MRIEEALLGIFKMSRSNGIEIKSVALACEEWSEMSSFLYKHMDHEVYNLTEIQEGKPFLFLGMKIMEKEKLI